MQQPNPRLELNALEDTVKSAPLLSRQSSLLGSYYRLSGTLRCGYKRVDTKLYVNFLYAIGEAICLVVPAISGAAFVPFPTDNFYEMEFRFMLVTVIAYI